MNTSAPILKHLLILAAITSVVGIIYGKVSVAYFCSYDDFDEIHRAAFEDTREPSRVFTTSHWNSYKYRPLNRAATLATYWIGQGNPIFFRVRNTVFHLLNVILVCALSYMLFGHIYLGGMAAVLFGLHPLTNQSVIGAVMTNTAAHSGFLMALILFITSLRVKRFWWQFLMTSVVIGWLSLLTYDSEIVIFPIMFLYLAIHFVTRQGQPVKWKFIVVFAIVSIVLTGSYFLLRALFVPHGWRQGLESSPIVGVVAKNIGMYIFALLLPVDPVLANEWLYTPLPSEIELKMSTAVIMMILALGIILVATFVIWRWRMINTLIIRTANWTMVLFLICGIVIPLLPVLAFTFHPSETYLYLPVAFYVLLLSYALHHLFHGSLTLRGRVSVAATFLILLVLFGAATRIRNERVAQCGETARRILYSLPGELLSDGSWIVSFANIAGEERSHRYGFYGFRGIDTIGDGLMANHAIRSALQLIYKNELLTGEVVGSEELIPTCSSSLSSRHICRWVHWDGRLEEF